MSAVTGLRNTLVNLFFWGSLLYILMEHNITYLKYLIYFLNWGIYPNTPLHLTIIG